MCSPKSCLVVLIVAAVPLLSTQVFAAANPAERIDDSARVVDSFFRQLPQMTQAKESRYTETESIESADGDYDCRTKTYVGSPGFSQMIFTRTNVDALYPGALLSGESVLDGSYALSAIPRAPVTLTVDLHNLPGEMSRTIDNPAFSTIQKAVHEILAQELDGDVGAEVTWEVMTIYSETQLKAALGMNFDIVDLLGAGADFRFETEAKYQRVIARFCQKYYDIIVDQPTRPSQFIDLAQVDMDDLQETVGDVSPVYISSVSYGRMALFYFESTDLSIDLESAVRASVNIAELGVPGTLSAERRLEIRSALAASSCKAYILGGSANDAVGAAFHGLDGLEKYILDGGTYSPNSPGKPMSFTLKYLSNSKPLRVIQAAEYTKTECYPRAPTYRFTLNEIETSMVDWYSPYGIFIVGAVTVRGRGEGNPEGGASLFLNPSTPGIYLDPAKPIKVDQWVDITFGPLTEAERKAAWIEIDVSTLWYNWGFTNYTFSPTSQKIYLNDLGNRPVDLRSPLNNLHLDYTITPR